MRIKLLFLSGFFALNFAFAQVKVKNTGYSIAWEGIRTEKLVPTDFLNLLSFEGAQYTMEDSFLPRFYQKIALSNEISSFSVKLTNEIYAPLLPAEANTIKNYSKINTTISPETSILNSKGTKNGVFTFIPLRKNPFSGQVEKLVSFDIDVEYNYGTKSTIRAAVYAANSVLKTGDWYKISIYKDGVYKIDRTFLESLGIDVTTIDPRNIRVYGNGGTMLPELNSDPHLDDLVENAIVVNGESDGVFDPSDYVLFYGKSSSKWQYSAGGTCPDFLHDEHLFSDSSYYFINFDSGLGKRIQNVSSVATPATHVVTSFDDYAIHETESVNFIKSGRQWFGELFDNISSYNFSFSFPNILTSSPVKVKVALASRLVQSGSSSNANYSITSGSGSSSLSIPSVDGSVYSDYARVASTCYTYNPASSVITVNVTKQTTNAQAWLDYILVNAKRNLTMSGSQMHFRDVASIGAGNVAQFNLVSNSLIQVWDVSDVTNVSNQVLSASGTTYQFTMPSDTIKEYVGFTGSGYLSPVKIGKIENQDLHGIAQKDYIIVTHPDFYDEAVRLALFHENADTLSTVVVTPQQIYNEFSSGSRDISAIRNFVKMFYDRAVIASERPKYLLLMGDGSYENKKNYSGNSNFIPTYQSFNSTVLTQSYVSDDYFGMLDDSEGLFGSDAVDIGVGRFPVKTKAEAAACVNKVLNYTQTGFDYTAISNACTSGLAFSSPFGDWRNVITFVGDDEDGGLHQKDADKLATLVDTTYNNYNIDKIYLDAFVQESTPGGQRFPAAKEAINKRIEKGCLVWNYTGHGGELGLAHERVVEVADINNWTNINNLPLVFTATCEFTRYDDPERTSAGEMVFLNPSGGAIAMFSTVRVVFAGPNFLLNQEFYKALETQVGGKMPTLGDLYYDMKNTSVGTSLNSRNFTLIGDPALRLAYPKHKISTDSINAVAVTAFSLDTIRALSTITISGFVRDKNNAVLTSYNGILYPTVFDKSQNVNTLSNDGSATPPFTFKLQKNILYKGKVSVVNGYFSYTFIVPKDILYNYGIGRISYYAQNGSEDGAGYYEKIIIGGTDSNAPLDSKGPDVSLYLNDDKFVFGGITDETPDLFAKIKDDNGVNTVGNGIGHDITAILDANTESSIVLNDYYQADLNSYKTGTIRYPFSTISEGQHSLTLKVWDVYNNSSQTYTEFVVAKSADMALSHVLNYPNPFTTKTQFYFEHNQCCQTLEVELQIFTISGKLVKTITDFVTAEGNRSNPINWDGRDDFGDKIGKGVYIYRLKVKNSMGSSAEQIEKLVILN